jgi:peptidyl-prolyl cis-trans isomerase A (cyclophilin A)
MPMLVPIRCALPLCGLFLQTLATAQVAKPAAPAAVITPPAEGPFTLAQATQGLPVGGPLRASIELEQDGKPLATIRCELFADKTPLTVANFVGLARGLRPFRDPKSGQWERRPFYDKGQIHRVIADFMIQGGDPWCASSPTCNGRPGTGDPGYAIADELRDELHFDRGGRLAMATRSGKDSGGSQFFITARETPWLNGSQTIFGQCEPADAIRAVAAVETQSADQPKVAVQIKRILISVAAGAAKNPVTK